MLHRYVKYIVESTYLYIRSNCGGSTYFEHVHDVRLVGSTKSHWPEQSCGWLDGGPPSTHSCQTRSGRTVAAVGGRCIDAVCSTDTVNGPDWGTRLLIATGDGGGVCSPTGVPVNRT